MYPLNQPDLMPEQFPPDGRLLQQILDLSPDIIHIYDLVERRNVYANRALAQVLGYASEAIHLITSDFFQEILHLDDWREHVAGSLERLVALQDNEVLEVDFRLRHADGDWRWLHGRYTIFSREAAGSPRLILGIARDVTARNRTEEELRHSEARIRAIVETAVDGIVTSDARGRIETFNPAAEKIFGYSADEVVGQSINLLMDSRDRQRHDGYMQNYLRSGVKKIIGIGREVTGRRKNGTTFPLYLAVGEAHLDGESHFVAVMSDLTQRKRAEETALELAVEQEKVRLLAEFIGTTSHDLRTPLTTIGTNVYLLKNVNDPQKQQKFLATIETQVDRLSHLINQLIVMTRLDRALSFETHPVDANGLVRDISSVYQTRVAEKGLHLALDLDPNLTAVQADGGLLARAFKNLVENAILYTPVGGEITLRTRQRPDAVTLEVQDSGIGIESHDLPHIFDRFFKVDKARSSETGGVGLGLAMVKKIAEMHKGRIEVDSAPGQGSTFRLALPR